MTKDPIPQETKDETLRLSCRPNIQRRHARRKTTTDRTGEKDQNLRGESHGSRQKTEQKAVRVTHARNNGHERPIPMILAEVPKGTLVKHRWKPKLLHAHQIGKVTKGRQDGAIGKQGSGEVMMERNDTTNGKETDGDLHPIGPSTFRGGVTRGAKRMRLLTVGSIRRKLTASMFATDAVSRKLARVRR